MKGAHALPLLLAGAIAAGLILYVTRSGTDAPPPGNQSDPADIALFLESETGLRPSPFPPIQAVSRDALAARIRAGLDERFGPDELTRKARAFELLGLLPPGLDLAALLVVMESGGIRAWCDPRSGDLLTVPDFDPARPDDRSTLVRLRARQLLHRQFPPATGTLSDDAWLAREALHAGLASALEARFLAAHGGGSLLPTAEETEREGTLMSLPIYLHNLAQIGTMQGRDYVESRRTDGPTPWAALLADPPAHTLALFGPAAPAPPPDLPATPPATLEESLGAYTTYLLLERLSDYLQAESVAPQWRGDRYRLFSTSTGDHLIWSCRWSTPEAAIRAARLIDATLSPEPDDPAFGTEARHRQVRTVGPELTFLNCADRPTLQSLLPPITIHQ